VKGFKWVVGFAAICAVRLVHADTVYTYAIPTLTDGSDTVSGTISTNTNEGQLTASTIVGWSFSFAVSGGSTLTFTGTTAVAPTFAVPFQITPTAINYISEVDPAVYSFSTGLAMVQVVGSTESNSEGGGGINYNDYVELDTLDQYGDGWINEGDIQYPSAPVMASLVPLPPAAWLMLSGLGLFAIFARNKTSRLSYPLGPLSGSLISCAYPRNS